MRGRWLGLLGVLVLVAELVLVRVGDAARVGPAGIVPVTPAPTVTPTPAFVPVPAATSSVGTDCDASNEVGRIWVDADGTPGQTFYVCSCLNPPTCNTFGWRLASVQVSVGAIPGNPGEKFEFSNDFTVDCLTNPRTCTVAFGSSVRTTNMPGTTGEMPLSLVEWDIQVVRDGAATPTPTATSTNVTPTPTSTSTASPTATTAPNTPTPTSAASTTPTPAPSPLPPVRIGNTAVNGCVPCGASGNSATQTYFACDGSSSTNAYQIGVTAPYPVKLININCTFNGWDLAWGKVFAAEFRTAPLAGCRATADGGSPGCAYAAPAGGTRCDIRGTLAVNETGCSARTDLFPAAVYRSGPTIVPADWQWQFLPSDPAALPYSCTWEMCPFGASQ